ncbi:MAG: hypothetical protein NTV84_03150, partial [Methanoregula sp.]|nr:hypothetical protein [Methanoregula sp.]
LIKEWRFKRSHARTGRTFQSLEESWQEKDKQRIMGEMLLGRNADMVIVKGQEHRIIALLTEKSEIQKRFTSSAGSKSHPAGREEEEEDPKDSPPKREPPDMTSCLKRQHGL